jgi:hypothetical protein
MKGIISNYQQELESTDYKACSYIIDGEKIIERTAKSTPKKIGQFVTCWKRNAKEITQPFESSDAFDFFTIKVFDDTYAGYFKFPKTTLIKHGIISTEKKEGKRGFRIYPTWSKPTSKQAIKTQYWQLKYFTNVD